MFHGHRIVVVMPAYNAAKTIEKTYREIPLDLVDDVLVTDDASGDDQDSANAFHGRAMLPQDYCESLTDPTSEDDVVSPAGWAFRPWPLSPLGPEGFHLQAGEAPADG